MQYSPYRQWGAGLDMVSEVDAKKRKKKSPSSSRRSSTPSRPILKARISETATDVGRLTLLGNVGLVFG